MVIIVNYCIYSDIDKECTVEFDLDEDIDAPVYIYYKIKGFYGNHRNYVKSRSYNQMGGEVILFYEIHISKK